MPTDCLFRDDSYLMTCDATVVAITEHGLVLDRTVFYANSGGQPGDRGLLRTEGGAEIAIETAVFTDPGKTEIAHVLPAGAARPAAGERIAAAIDWDTRYRRMRMHTRFTSCRPLCRFRSPAARWATPRGGSISTSRRRASTRTRSPKSSPA
jgi:misacylated tRNA(Ala) deacylase